MTSNLIELQMMQDLLLLGFVDSESVWYYSLLDAIETALQDYTNTILIDKVCDATEMFFIHSI